MNPLDIIAIPEHSANQDAAWELVKYIAGDDVAKYLAFSPLELGFSSRMKWNESGKDMNVQAFYQLPSPDVEFSDISFEIQDPFTTVLNEQFQLFLQNNQDIDTVMETVEKKAQEVLGKEEL